MSQTTGEFQTNFAYALLHEGQTEGVTAEACASTAQTINAGNFAVRSAAQAWLRDGKMPDEPEIAGSTPRSLSEKGYNSWQVFTIIGHLSLHREEAEELIARFPAEGPIPPRAHRI